MHTALTVVLVARAGDPDPREALRAIRQNTTPIRLVVVDTGKSAEASLRALEEHADRILRLPSQTPFAQSVQAGLEAANQRGEDAWLWMLTAACVPAPGTLDRLLAELERFPSVGVAGPKLLSTKNSDGRLVLRSVGLTMTTAGAIVRVGATQPDQAQYDARSDTLGVPAEGMLVRVALWEKLGGFDPALSGADAAVDFGVRARLNGDRIVVVPAARVRVDGDEPILPEREVERARYLRQLSYPGVRPRSGGLLRAGLLAGLPVALFTRGAGSALARLRGAWAAAGDSRLRIRRREIAAGSSAGWTAIIPFLVSPAEAERLSGGHDLELSAEEVVELPEETSFWHSRAPLFTVLMLVLSLLIWWRLLGSNGLSGGAAAPLPATLKGLWRTALSGIPLDRAAGAADLFAVALGVVGSLVPWSPGIILTVLVVVALPLAFVAGWCAAVRVVRAGWVRVLFGVCWAFSPVLLTSLSAGQFGAAAAHIALAAGLALFLDIFRGTSSVGWVRAGLRLGCALAVVLVGAPTAGVLTVVLVLVGMALRPRRIGTFGMAFIPIGIAVLPALITVLLRGGWLGLLADPGLPVHANTSPLALALGIPDASLSSLSFLPTWSWMIAGVGTAVLLVLTLWLVLTRRSLSGILLVMGALAAVLAAVLLSNARIVRDWEISRAPWTGGLLSLAGLSLLCGAAVLLGAVRGAQLAGTVLAVAVTVSASPFFVNAFLGSTQIAPTTGPESPAIVLANQKVHPGDRTLLIRALSDGSYGVRLQRGDGTTLTSLNRLSPGSTGSDDGLATFAAGLVSGSSVQVRAQLRSRNIMFVLLSTGNGTAWKAAQSALNSEGALTPVGETAYGMLWQVRAPAHHAAPSGGIWTWVSGLQAVLFVLFATCLLPSRRRRRTFSQGLVQPSGGDPDVAGRQ